jgi:hypothetical protein
LYTRPTPIAYLVYRMLMPKSLARYPLGSRMIFSAYVRIRNEVQNGTTTSSSASILYVVR